MFFQTARHPRAYATTPSPPPAGRPASNPMAKKEPDNTLLYVALGLAAVGGAYFYFKNPDDDQDLKAKATREAGQRKQKGSESVDAVKTRADKILRYGEAKYDQVTVLLFIWSTPQ